MGSQSLTTATGTGSRRRSFEREIARQRKRCHICPRIQKKPTRGQCLQAIGTSLRRGQGCHSESEPKCVSRSVLHSRSFFVQQPRRSQELCQVASRLHQRFSRCPSTWAVVDLLSSVERDCRGPFLAHRKQY